MRDDLQLISDWIPADASLLDLGCGDGTLLAHLQHHKQIRGYGLEINQDNLAACFEKASMYWNRIWTKAWAISRIIVSIMW